MAGSIQGNINQALGTLGVLAQLSPQLKEHAENIAESRKLDKRQKVLDKQTKAAVQDEQKKFTPDAEGNVTIDPQTESELRQARRDLMRRNKEQEDISRARYDLKPTLENYQRWQTDAAINQNARDAFADLKKKQRQAMGRVGNLQDAKKTQRRDFMDYISKMPMLGETVGSIDARNPGFAKKIASQYGKKDREKIMNQMDKEGKNGKSN